VMSDTVGSQNQEVPLSYFSIPALLLLVCCVPSWGSTILLLLAAEACYLASFLTRADSATALYHRLQHCAVLGFLLKARVVLSLLPPTGFHYLPSSPLLTPSSLHSAGPLLRPLPFVLCCVGKRKKIPCSASELKIKGALR